MSEESARDSLPQFLAQRARNASDGRLALDAAGGLIAVAATVVVEPPFNILLAAVGTCFVAFGLWGITDRELGERRASIGTIGAALLVTARATAAFIGVIGGFALIFGSLAITLGTWIS